MQCFSFTVHTFTVTPGQPDCPWENKTGSGSGCHFGLCGREFWGPGTRSVAHKPQECMSLWHVDSSQLEEDQNKSLLAKTKGSIFQTHPPQAWFLGDQNSCSTLNRGWVYFLWFPKPRAQVQMFCMLRSASHKAETLQTPFLRIPCQLACN